VVVASAKWVSSNDIYLLKNKTLLSPGDQTQRVVCTFVVIRTIGIALHRDFLKNIISVLSSNTDGNLVPSEAPDTLLQGAAGH